jgi:hypothetical protein
MSFGGILGLGHEHYPVPWPRLDYNKELGGYELNVSEQELKDAPKFDPGAESEWSGADKGREIHAYYGVPAYWI